jgi:hypothetical protein
MDGDAASSFRFANGPLHNKSVPLRALAEDRPPATLASPDQRVSSGFEVRRGCFPGIFAVG